MVHPLVLLETPIHDAAARVQRFRSGELVVADRHAVLIVNHAALLLMTLIGAAPAVGVSVVSYRIAFVLKCGTRIHVRIISKAFNFHHSVVVGKCPIVLLAVRLCGADHEGILSIHVP